MKIFFNSFNIDGLKRLSEGQIAQTAQNNGSVSYPNLKPLEKDTVSFSGRKTLIASDMSIAPSVSNCAKVNKDAEPARFYLNRILDEYIGPYVDTTDTLDTRDYPVLACKVRVKSPLSIREKVVSKYSAAYSKMADDFAKKVYDELSRYYVPNPDCNVKAVLNEVKSCIEGHDSRGEFLAYSNPALNYHIALMVLQEANAFKFDALGHEKQSAIDTEIIKNIIQYVRVQEPMQSTESAEGIKSYANDIVGARIVLREPDPNYTKKVFSALKAAVEAGKLKITSIENNIPDPDKLPEGDSVSDYIYAHDYTLQALRRVSGSELKTNKSKSGYMAVHINVDFSDCDFAKNKRYSGYKGEIQILGREVEKLKEIEDLCYKLKDNKNAIKSEYKPFKTHFEKYYTGDTKDVFDDYTYKMYLAQRRKPKSPKRKDFPSPAQLGFKDKLPEQLDFNQLAKIKAECDAVIKMNEAKELINEIQATIIGKKSKDKYYH